MPTKLHGKAKAFEQKAQQIRQFAGASSQQRFDPLALANQLKIIVISDAKELKQHLHLDIKVVEQLFLNNSMGWSGGATPDRPDGTRVVILNPTHSLQRQAVTLMEEVCHILLGHHRSTISPDQEKLRDYNHRIEEEAYGVGAAVLLPHEALASSIDKGWQLQQIAEYFGISVSLVRFRCKFLGIKPPDSINKDA
jgi:Zn-dependent peptidase ImmA (M78 family)